MIDSYGTSDVGLVRSHNEDCYVVNQEQGLFAVADGMGGAQAGETASRIAIDTLIAEVSQDGPRASAATLERAVRLANRNVRWEAEQNPAYEGMGTTVVAALARPAKLYLINVGDSRCYLWTAGELFCVTADDSWVNDVGRGLGLSEEQLRVHPYRNVLTKAVGAEEDLQVKAQEIDFLPGDTLLICSDGLHGVAGEDALLEVLKRPASLEARCQALVEAALAKGAPDNVTVVLVQALDSGSDSEP
ncbi:MAG: Stp1/IreP family PP2C-type Ser/Thr phosphatase [Acidobacteria bacterium]|nr:Stp1/IreP family PP2C-type Ser/Thr phosphatase [Acidobacteriota bacterium]